MKMAGLEKQAAHHIEVFDFNSIHAQQARSLDFIEAQGREIATAREAIEGLAKDASARDAEDLVRKASQDIAAVNVKDESVGQKFTAADIEADAPSFEAEIPQVMPEAPAVPLAAAPVYSFKACRETKFLIDCLEREGWKLRQGGKHTIYMKDGRSVALPRHGLGKEITRGTLANIFRTVGWKHG